jgi:putative endonuclease
VNVGGGSHTAGKRQETGTEGEQLALSLLSGLGYRLVERNWRCRVGEIDLIMTDGPVLVFVEVKTRRGAAYGLPQEAVGRRKRVRLRRLAECYLKATGGGRREVRFDVVGITLAGSGASLVEHLKAVF